MNLPFVNKPNGEENNYNPFPDLPPKKNANKNAAKDYALLAFSLLIFISSLLTYSYFSNKTLNSSDNSSSIGLNPTEYSQSNAQAKSTPTPKLLPSGPQTYNFSHGSEVVGPKPSKAIINPIDPRSGEVQKFTVEINHLSPVIKATATLVTDSGEKTFPLKLIDGTKTAGTWEVSWKMNDTFNYKYQVILSITGENNTFSGGLTFR